jgi:alkyl hydroperoxide reductase subunit AhpC
MHTNGEPASTIAETLGVSRQTHTVFAAWRRSLTATATIEPVEKPRTTDSLRAVLDATVRSGYF